MNKREILRIIGTNIRNARLKANMTQEGFAELLGIHWKTVGYIESGKRDFGASTLTLIMMRLKVPSAELLHGIHLDHFQIETILHATARKRRPKATSS